MSNLMGSRFCQTYANKSIWVYYREIRQGPQCCEGEG